MMMKNGGQIRHLVKILELRSKLHLHEKEYEKALNDALLAYNFSHKLEGVDGALIHYLVSIACYGITTHVLSDLIGSRKLNKDQLQKILIAAKKNSLDNRNFKNTFKVDLRSFLYEFAGFDTKNVDMLKAQLIPFQIFLKDKERGPYESIDKNSLSLNELVKHCESGLTSIFADIDKAQPWKAQARKLYDRKAKRQIIQDLKNNKLSLILIHNTYFPSLSNTANSFFQAQNNQRALILAAAIQLFEKRNSKLPENLTEILKNNILKVIPKDIWTGRSFLIDWQKRQISHKKPNGYETVYKF
jgi:hypothetical protein